MKAKERDIKIARSVKNQLNRKLGNNLVSVILYGSRAEGTAKKDSDLDLFLLMRKKPRYGSHQDDAIVDVANKGLEKYNIQISPVVYSITSYRKQNNLSFIKAVNKGVRI